MSEEFDEPVLIEKSRRARNPHYLIVLQHGILAVAGHFENFESAIVEKWSQPRACLEDGVDPQSPVLPLDDNVHIFRPTVNESFRSFRGIDVCGRLLADAVVAFYESSSLSSLPRDIPIYLVFVGHSLGGLISRAAIGHLFGEASSGDGDSFWDRITPHSFMSLATPHLGVCMPPVLPSFGLRLKKFFHDKVGCESGVFLGTTGKELVFKDVPDVPDSIDQQPLLTRMAEPEQNYFRGLSQFRFLTVTGSSHHDFKVPFCSATIRACMPYPSPENEPYFQPRIMGLSGFTGPAMTFLMQMCADHDWLPFVDGFDRGINDGYFGETPTETTGAAEEEAGEDGEERPAPVFVSDNVSEVSFPRRVLENLQALPWRRLDVQFQVTRPPPIFVYETHSVWLRKNMPFASTQHVLAGTTTVDMLVEILLTDLQLGLEE